MNRETLKTVGGLVIVAVIVAATFMYGNQQREAQQRHDQELKQQQTKQPQDGASTTPQQPAAPNQPLQGGNQPQITATRTPETGGELVYLAGLTTIALLWRLNRKAQKAVRQAALSL